MFAVVGARAGEAGVAELLDDHLELAGRRGEIEHAIAARALAVELLEHGGEPRVALRVVELPLHVARGLQEAFAHRAVDDLFAVVVVDRRAHALAELIVADLLTSVAHEGGAERQHAVTTEVVESRDQLAVRQISRDPEHDEAAGVGVTVAAERRGRADRPAPAGDVDPAVLGEVVGLVVAEVPAGGLVVHRHSFSLTAWPPNSLRSAASTLPLNVSAWRERKRMKSAAVMAGIGTEWAIPCSTVQRPSPVSST